MAIFGASTSFLFQVSCRWWGKHHGPPSMSLFLSTSTPHPGIRLRNQENYLVPACLNDRLTSFRHEFTSLNLDWKISSIVWLQVLYSHSMVCTEIPWESLTLMMITLALVNSLHYWLVIKWSLPCSTSRYCNHMNRIVPCGRWDEDLGYLLSTQYFPQIAMEYLYDSYDGSTLYVHGCAQICICMT